jgi:hypothetical protein
MDITSNILITNFTSIVIPILAANFVFYRMFKSDTARLDDQHRADTARLDDQHREDMKSHKEDMKRMEERSDDRWEKLLKEVYDIKLFQATQSPKNKT